MRRSSAADLIYEYVKNQIATKRLYPGNRIVEEDIVRATGISRTAIRPALLRLKYEGLVEQQPHRGTFVARPSLEDLRYVCQTRTLLEVDAFRLAVLRRSEESLRAMERNLQRQVELEKKFTMAGYVEMNREFHGIISAAAGNPYYEKYLNELQNKVSTYLLFWERTVGSGNSLETHRQIYEAFRDRDAEKGVTALMADICLFEEGVWPRHN